MSSNLRYFLGEPCDRPLLGEPGHNGGVVSCDLEARWLANLAEDRVGYGSYVSYPAPCSGAPGTLKLDGDGGGGVDAMINDTRNETNVNFRLKVRRLSCESRLCDTVDLGLGSFSSFVTVC